MSGTVFDSFLLYMEADMKYKCLIFDLDGTLVNSIHALTYCTNLSLEKFELTSKAKELGLKIAVVSNKPDAQAKKTVEYVFGAGYFDTVIGEQEGVPKKPDPSGALKAAKICGADPSECLYFGDTNTDMKTGKNAKMTTVGVLWGFRGREELAAFQPEFLLEKPLDILTEIEK